MSDLSRLLEDVYRSETAPEPPEWSSDEALDDAFASWVPGPTADAHAAERAVVERAAAMPAYEPPPSPGRGELDAAATAPDVEPEPEPRPVDVAEPTVEAIAQLHHLPATPSIAGYNELERELQLLQGRNDPEPEPAVTLATVVPIRGRWLPADDDILPGRTGPSARAKATRSASLRRQRPAEPTVDDTAPDELPAGTRRRGFRRR